MDPSGFASTFSDRFPQCLLHNTSLGFITYYRALRSRHFPPANVDVPTRRDPVPSLHPRITLHLDRTIPTPHRSYLQGTDTRRLPLDQHGVLRDPFRLSVQARH